MSLRGAPQSIGRSLELAQSLLQLLPRESDLEVIANEQRSILRFFRIGTNSVITNLDRLDPIPTCSTDIEDSSRGSRF